MTNKLTAKERKNLKTLEEVIEAGLGTFSRVGRALLQIRDCRLYRGSFESFDAYCQERWEFSRQRAHQLITAASTAEELSTIVDTPPAREAHVRPLLNVPEEHRPKVWQEAVKSAPPGPDGKPRITARCVERAVEDWHRTRLLPRDQVIDVESLPVEVPKQISVPPSDGNLVRCRCCGRDVEPDEDGDCPLCHEPEIALRMPEREDLTPRAYVDDDGQVVAVIHGLNDRWISARGRHRVKSPLLPPRATWEQAQADLDTYAAARDWRQYETDQPVAVDEPPAVELGVPLESRPNWLVDVGAIAYAAIECEGRPAVAQRLQELADEILMG